MEIKLQSDIDTLLRCGTLPAETEDAVNFKQGTENIKNTLIQSSKNHEDKVFRVSVICNGDPLEIYTDADGEVIFKKYSQVGELSSLTAQYAEVLHKNTGLPVVITDRDRVISCAGVPKKETVERRITQALENIMENRSPFICEEGGERFHPIEGVERDAAAAFPIIGAGDVSGAVVLLTADEASVPTQTEIKLVQVAASFLGKQMEE